MPYSREWSQALCSCQFKQLSQKSFSNKTAIRAPKQATMSWQYPLTWRNHINTKRLFVVILVRQIGKSDIRCLIAWTWSAAHGEQKRRWVITARRRYRQWFGLERRPIKETSQLFGLPGCVLAGCWVCHRDKLLLLPIWFDAVTLLSFPYSQFLAFRSRISCLAFSDLATRFRFFLVS